MCIIQSSIDPEVFRSNIDYDRTSRNPKNCKIRRKKEFKFGPKLTLKHGYSPVARSASISWKIKIDKLGFAPNTVLDGLDREKKMYTISGKKIREDPKKHFGLLTFTILSSRTKIKTRFVHRANVYRSKFFGPKSRR